MPYRWRSAPAHARPALVLAVIAAAATTVLSSAMVAAVREGRALESAVESELLSVAELHATRVAEWRREHEEDLALMLDVPSLARATDALLRGERSADAPQIVEFWRSVAAHLRYSDIQLLEPAGDTLLAISGAPPPAAARHSAAEAIRTRAPVWTVLQDANGSLRFALAGPVVAPDGAALAALVIIIDPRAELYASLATWPRPSETAESLVVAPDGDAAVIVSPRRSPALPTRVPLHLESNTAVQAVRGLVGLTRGVTFAGDAVVAAIRPVPGCSWAVVARMHEAEAQRPAKTRFRAALLLGTLAAVLVTGIAATAWWRRALRLVREGRAEQERERVAMARHRDLLAEHASDVVLLMASDGRILEANERAVETYGWSRSQLLAMNIRDLRALEAPAATALDGEPVGALRLETEHRRRDGSTLPVAVSSRTFEAAGVTYRQTIVRDLSVEKAAEADRRRLEEQVFVSERMASLGTLAAGIAHEINNPLSFVISNVRYAADELDAGGGDLAEIRSALTDAAEGGRRVQEIVRDLKTFARGDTRAGTTDDLAAVVRSTLTLAQNELKYRARLRVELSQLPPVNGSPHRLGQVFLNLLVNAAQALPEGRADEHEIRVAAGVAGDKVWVEVGDDGPGVPPELRQRIFDPFFTTKPLGVGTGLGLSICHGIVSAAGGTIALAPAERGALFRVELRRADESATEPTRPMGAGTARRVLVIDDEPRVARAIERVLRPHHEVVYAGNAREALARVGRDGGFDVVLCDVMMPDMTGMDLFEEIARLDPGLSARVVFITGGAFTPRAREFLDRVENLKVEKPFDDATLLEVVSRVAARA